ncbi:MAG: NAD(P)H-quinone oxidoreductase [Clostridia bacterium]|nr:NAD(P)H-quinone oxidoreductase [Clostridia bacterium]
MKAVLIQQDQSLIWADVPDPVIQPDEVLVRIEYAALNRADLMQREGKYPPPPGCPEWMGLEISGEIASMGPDAQKDSSFKIGDKVCALLGGGGYAEFVSVRYDMLMPIPENCSMIEAAAMPEAFATAYLNMFIEGQIQPGDTLLVTAGASGLASVMIRMAKAFGIRVITTVRKDHQVEAIRPLGADLIVNTSKEDLAEVLRAQLDAGTPVIVAIDCLGGEIMGRCLPYLARGGRWIMIATLAGDPTTVDLRNVYVRGIRIIGSTLRSRAPEVKVQILKSLVRDVWPKAAAGLVRPTVCKVLPITQAEEAHALLYNGQNIGKVVLKVN